MLFLSHALKPHGPKMLRCQIYTVLLLAVFILPIRTCTYVLQICIYVINTLASYEHYFSYLQLAYVVESPCFPKILSISKLMTMVLCCQSNLVMFFPKSLWTLKEGSFTIKYEPHQKPEHFWPFLFKLK